MMDENIGWTELEALWLVAARLYDEGYDCPVAKFLQDEQDYTTEVNRIITTLRLVHAVGRLEVMEDQQVKLGECIERLQQIRSEMSDT